MEKPTLDASAIRRVWKHSTAVRQPCGWTTIKNHGELLPDARQFLQAAEGGNDEDEDEDK